jgi:hypothetical protein
MGKHFAVSSRQLLDISEPQMNFLESSSLKNYSLHDLPDPPTVKQLAPAGKNLLPNRHPQRLRTLGLLVKYGPYVTRTEARNLWLRRRALCDGVPVPAQRCTLEEYMAQRYSSTCHSSKEPCSEVNGTH